MATPAFSDHFSTHAADYARYRPEYPSALFDWLAHQAPSRSCAVDVATGNGQAAHWFDWPAYCREAARVLKPRAIFAIWSYAYCTVSPAVDAIILDFARDVVGPYWPRERHLVDAGYRGLAMPFAEIEAPPFEMTADWDLPTMLGYVGTWSAVGRCRTRNGRDPMALLAPALAEAWGEGAKTVRWPLTIRAARA